MKYFSLILFPVFLLVISRHSVAKETGLLHLIQQQYKSTRSFSGHFVQTSYRTNTKTAPRMAEGKVYYKQPGKMRWLYEAPEEQLLVTNGETLWLFDPLLENVTIQKLEQLTDGTALSFLLGFGDLRLDFIRREISEILLENTDGLIVELEPKKTIANLAFLQLEVHPETYDIQKIVFMDQEGNYRTITLEAMQYNLTLDDDIFEFKVTPGMDVIEDGKR